MFSSGVRADLELSDMHEDDFGGMSLALFWPVIENLIASVRPSNLVEIGADRGILTRRLLEAGKNFGFQVHAVDPSPAQSALNITGIKWHLMTSEDYIVEGSVKSGFWILDGDHNYVTVEKELAGAIRLRERELPLAIIVHDVSWPSARRDFWYSVDRAPVEPNVLRDFRLSLDEDGVSEGAGFPLKAFGAARNERGGARNGVLTAVEDFLRDHPEFVFRMTPLNFGLGVLLEKTFYESERCNAFRAYMDAFDLLKPMLAATEANRLRVTQALNERWVQGDVWWMERQAFADHLSVLKRRPWLAFYLSFQAVMQAIRGRHV